MKQAMTRTVKCGMVGQALQSANTGKAGTGYMSSYVRGNNAGFTGWKLFAAGSLALLFAMPAARAWGFQEPAVPATQSQPASAGQSAPADDSDSKKQDKPAQDVDPLKRPLSDKQRFDRRKQLKQELSSAYKTWLDQDVAWIISDDERKAFKNLSNDEERDAFI